MNTTPAVSSHPKSNRRWFQFRLRTLLLVTAGCAVVLAMWTTYLSPYRAQHRAIAALTELGAVVTTEPAGPAWLRKLVGDEYLVNLTFVSFPFDSTDSDLKHLKGLNNLEVLWSGGTPVSDAGLNTLRV